ncbi:MAG: hypothetical protein RLZZ505_1173 [Verrucomicrobiota bacterium]
MISPHPWGWPEDVLNSIDALCDFPTPVGMARDEHLTAEKFLRFPHTRGDGPAVSRLEDGGYSISPHPWGWPDDGIIVWAYSADFPTPVGMARRGRCGCRAR